MANKRSSGVVLGRRDIDSDSDSDNDHVSAGDECVAASSTSSNDDRQRWRRLREDQAAVRAPTPYLCSWLPPLSLARSLSLSSCVLLVLVISNARSTVFLTPRLTTSHDDDDDDQREPSKNINNINMDVADAAAADATGRDQLATTEPSSWFGVRKTMFLASWSPSLSLSRGDATANCCRTSFLAAVKLALTHAR